MVTPRLGKQKALSPPHHHGEDSTPPLVCGGQLLPASFPPPASPPHLAWQGELGTAAGTSMGARSRQKKIIIFFHIGTEGRQEESRTALLFAQGL